MQSTRFLAVNMLRQQAAARTRMSTTSMIRSQPARRTFQTGTRRSMPVPKEEHSAHTISQRIRTLKKIPPELVPLGVVLAVAIVAAGYSMIRKLYTDKTLRLSRQGPQH